MLRHPRQFVYETNRRIAVGIPRNIARNNTKAKRGHSKDKRTDCPLLTLGLVLDASGFVRRSQVFAGNVTEHRTLARMLEALNAPCDALVVMDRGIATEDCVRWLRENAYRYLVVSRERTRYFDPERAQRIETASRHGVHLHKSVSEDGQEVRLHCFSEERANKERAIVERFAGRFEHALTQLNEGLSRPRTQKRTHKLRERIARLKAKSRGIAQHYHIDIDTDETGERATAVRFTRTPVDGSMMTHPGVYCLRSNQIDWDEETLWRTFATLTDIEAVFRSLKSELGLRPIFHHKPIRAEGHLFITVLAYQLVQVIRRRLRQGGEHASWNTLRGILEGHLAHHRHLPPRRWAHLACAKGHPCRAASARHLRRTGARPRTRRHPQDHRLAHQHALVVPLAPLGCRNYLIPIPSCRSMLKLG